ncbi:TrkA C-terminal domain-containing protein [Cohnella nanjingensis]|uniref:TrkA C-terminal domain-containing protein n=1 Tax=Cohnella nanjingensis TaxID=1387779 RepID=A0A7X0VHW7_9BACL|nr:TrkA C-terminal domain-containing protein [Cohnella nanjingensis]MBB6674351.1 TrkA C-terminal domain-containing protein [Cohnella nanjingensis]
MWFIVVYFLIVLFVIEIAVVLMWATGLEYPIARFQVVSLLTGTGFTTSESELILGHPVRRRVGIFLILFGAFSLAVVISCISTVLAPDFHLLPLSIGAGILFAILVVLRLPATKRYLSERLTRAFQQTFELQELSIDEVLLCEEGDAFVDVPIGKRSRLAGQTLDQVCKELKDLNVLLIKRGTVTIRDARMHTPLEAGDVLYIYGNEAEIERRFAGELADKKSMETDEKHAASLL